MIRICGIEKESIVDGSGIRYVIFSQGCPHNCQGCHNPESHSFNAGDEKKIEDILIDIKKNPLLKGVTFSGGEPFEQATGFLQLAQKIKTFNLDIWCFTGYTIEELLNSNDQSKISLLNNVDILVDGKFEKELRTIEKPFVGSSNQRIIDVKKSNKNELIFWNEYDNLDY